MESILNAIFEITGILLAAGLTYLANIAVKEWKLDKLVTAFVKAADQLYKSMDEDGSIRLSYVESQLVDAGIKLTNAVRAKIEAKVLDLNMEQTSLHSGGDQA